MNKPDFILSLTIRGFILTSNSVNSSYQTWEYNRIVVDIEPHMVSATSCGTRMGSAMYQIMLIEIDKVLLCQQQEK